MITNNGANPMTYRFATGGPAATFAHALAASATFVYDAKVPVSSVTGFSASGTTYTVTKGI